MSWETRIQNNIQITTGDGQNWFPLMRVDSYQGSFEFNISEFEFPEIAGTKVDRRLRKGVRYPMEFYFQGPDCVDVGRAFIEASTNTKFWQIIHPMFGQFKGQPINIEFDTIGINVFTIKTTVVETITDDGAKTVFDPNDNAKFVLNRAKDRNVQSFQTSTTNKLELDDVQVMQQTTEQVYEQTAVTITDQEQFNEYTNLYNAAQTKINTALNDVLFEVTIVQDFLNYPAQFVQDIKTKLILLKNQILALNDAVENLNPSFTQKKVYEFQAGALITTIIESISTPQDDDYQSAVDVFYVIEQSIDTYNSFINQLQNLQNGNGYESDAYAPSAEFLEALSYSFNYSIANLFEIALTAQQQRVISLEEDSNVIIQTHRFYGLDQEDVNLKRFVTTNNIGLNETLQLKKGRKLVYYV